MRNKGTLLYTKKVLVDFYCIATVCFAIWMLFFDYQNIFSQYRLYKHLQQLKKDYIYYTFRLQQIKKTKKEHLHNSDLLEKLAREKYYMKREKEDLYVIIHD